MDAPLDAVHRVLLLHLHRVTQAERPEEQILVLLQMQSTCSFRTILFQRLSTDHSKNRKKNVQRCSHSILECFTRINLNMVVLLLLPEERCSSLYSVGGLFFEAVNPKEFRE